jgi:DNA-binding NtrC family response regulator
MSAWSPENGPAVDSAEHDLLELRCLHELARQLLPLATRREVARDGLLCIAGITGVGAGAVLWRGDESAPLDLLGHFGLDTQRFRKRYRVTVEAQRFLMDGGAVTTEAARRRASGRALIRSLHPLDEHVGEAWILPLHGEQRLRGMLLMGPSLVTQELLPRPGWLADLAEVLRLALLGCGAGDAQPKKQPPRKRPRKTQAPAPSVAGTRGVLARIRALRRRHPETEVMVGESPALLVVLEEIVSLAGTDYTVLIHGATGTGKELAAHLLHRLSRRASGPFEAVDCSSIPQELIESELFGHVKGAFTGATRNFRGAFERADGGTLLLDEIGDMDFRSQTRLLRVLQEGSVRRLGGDRPVPVDVRVIAATNRDLAELVRQGRFREDLYYRIHVCPLPIPALRERGEDRFQLFESLMKLHAAELERAPRALSATARKRLREEEFPGNVRQLQNVVRQLLVQRSARGVVEVEELERVLARAASLPRAGATEVATPTAARNAADSANEAGTAVERDPRAARPQHVDEAPTVGTSPPGASEPRGLVDTGTAPPAVGAQAAVEDVGEWVVEQLRSHRFNLLAAARHLQERRRLGARREVVPVFDRGALDYYLCGEFFRRLVERAFRMEPVVAEIAGSNALVPRVRRKVRAYLRPLQALRRIGPHTASALLRDGYRRVPERYHVEIEVAIEALRKGRWKLG